MSNVERTKLDQQVADVQNENLTLFYQQEQQKSLLDNAECTLAATQLELANVSAQLTRAHNAETPTTAQLHDELDHLSETGAVGEGSADTSLSSTASAHKRAKRSMSEFRSSSYVGVCDAVG